MRTASARGGIERPRADPGRDRHRLRHDVHLVDAEEVRKMGAGGVVVGARALHADLGGVERRPAGGKDAILVVPPAELDIVCQQHLAVLLRGQILRRITPGLVLGGFLVR